MREPSVTIAFRKGATTTGQDYDWQARVSRGRLFVNFGSVVCIMFDDPQEGMDLLRSLTNVVNYDEPNTTEPTAVPASSTDEEPF